MSNDDIRKEPADESPENSGRNVADPAPQSHTETSKPDKPDRRSSSFGLGFILGLAISLILAAYPLYLAFFSQQDQEKIVSQAIIDTMQMQITLAHKELESVNRQLEMIADAEARYQQLVEQRFDLETNRTHLLERIENLESNLQSAEQELGVEANKFDRITETMRLE